MPGWTIIYPSEYLYYYTALAFSWEYFSLDILLYLNNNYMVVPTIPVAIDYSSIGIY